MTDTARDAARYLFEQYRTPRALEPFDEPRAPRNIEEAYAIQAELVRLRSAAEGPVGGYKLGYTTAAMQARSGLTEPALGHLRARTIWDSPARVRAADYVGLGVECEVAVRLGADLPASGVPYTRDAVADAVQALMAAIEVIDIRGPAAGDERARAMMGVAANVWNAGVVCAAPVADWRSLDLPGTRGSLTVNGETVGEGHGRDVMGHPLEPLAWLANALAARGLPLRAGMLVITGSFVPPKLLAAGDEAVVTVEGLGRAVLAVE